MNVNSDNDSAIIPVKSRTSRQMIGIEYPNNPESPIMIGGSQKCESTGKRFEDKGKRETVHGPRLIWKVAPF